MFVGQFPVGLKAAILCNKRLLILKRREDDWCGGEWDFAGGAMNEGEMPEDSLKREILEETGLKAEIVKPLRVWCLENEHGSRTVGITFLVDASDETVVLSEEHSEYQWITESELQELQYPDWLKTEGGLAFHESGIS